MKKTRVFISFKLLAIFLITMLLIPFAGCAKKEAAPTAVGTVKKISKGKLEKQEKQVWKGLKAGDKIFTNDKLRTNSTAVALLSLDNVGGFLIGPNTEYTLGKNPSDFKTFLDRGYVWFKSGLTKGAKMNISTVSAIAGVRGTKFSVLNDAEGADVCTCKGEVEVILKNDKTMNVGSGMYSSIDAHGKAETPKKGKILLTKLWKGKEKRHSACRECHRKGKKVRDLI